MATASHRGLGMGDARCCVDEVLHARLYADSLGMPRLGQVLPGQRYIRLLESWWQENTGLAVQLVDRARGSQTLVELFAWYEQDCLYYGEQMDVLIIQGGVVDCAPRPLPRRVRNRLSRASPVVRKYIIGFLHRARPSLFRLGVRFHYTHMALFRDTCRKWLTRSAEDCGRVYVFSIAPTLPHIEAHSPGFSRSIESYNRVLEETVVEVNRSNVLYVDTCSAIRSRAGGPARFIFKEDGHHLTEEGNRLYAESIIALEERRLAGHNG